jgi:hypothetical protein
MRIRITIGLGVANQKPGLQSNLKGSLFSGFSSPPIRLALATAARAVSQHWSGRFSRNKDQNAPFGGAHPLVVVGRPNFSDTSDTFGREWVFHQKSTISRIGFNYMDQNDPFHETLPVRTSRDTVGHSRFMAFFPLFVSFRGVSN